MLSHSGKTSQRSKSNSQDHACSYRASFFTGMEVSHCLRKRAKRHSSRNAVWSSKPYALRISALLSTITITKATSVLTSADHMYLEIAILSHLQDHTSPPHMLMSVISAHSYDPTQTRLMLWKRKAIPRWQSVLWRANDFITVIGCFLHIIIIVHFYSDLRDVSLYTEVMHQDAAPSLARPRIQQEPPIEK